MPLIDPITIPAISPPSSPESGVVVGSGAFEEELGVDGLVSDIDVLDVIVLDVVASLQILIFSSKLHLSKSSTKFVEFEKHFLTALV